jgi:hypothetical protein
VLWKNSNLAIFYAGFSNKEPRIATKIAWISGSKAKMTVFGGQFGSGMLAPESWDHVREPNAEACPLFLLHVK